MRLESRPPARAARSRRAWAAAAVIIALAVGGCTQQTTSPPAESGVVEGLVFATDGGDDLELDACLPERSEGPIPSVVLLHGGAFTDGDRVGGGMREICTQLAQQGIAAFSADYRLAPEYRYPAQLQDVGAAVGWLREATQVDRFGLDPERIGVIGSSAGAILAQSIGTLGEGDLGTGERVSVVVSLSGVSLVTEDALTLGEPSSEAAALVLNYLGCVSPSDADCPQARDASPITHVDPTDPPMILLGSEDELVPREQAGAMGDALDEAGIEHVVSLEPGERHGVALLDADNRRLILQFLRTHL